MKATGKEVAMRKSPHYWMQNAMLLALVFLLYVVIVGFLLHVPPVGPSYKKQESNARTTSTMAKS